MLSRMISDDPFYTNDLAELYKTRLKELGGIDYSSLSSGLVNAGSSTVP